VRLDTEALFVGGCNEHACMSVTLWHLTPQLHCILKMVHDDYVIAVVCELMFGEQYYISRPLDGRLKLPDRIQSVVVP
jgi:hypothetical protein